MRPKLCQWLSPQFLFCPSTLPSLIVSSQKSCITFSMNEYTRSPWDHLFHMRISALEYLSKLSTDTHLTSPPSPPTSAEDERNLKFHSWTLFNDLNLMLGWGLVLAWILKVCFFRLFDLVLLLVFWFFFFLLTDNDWNPNWYGHLNSIRVCFHFLSIIFTHPQIICISH